MAKKKSYVVWKGLKPGIYNNWNDCKAQIDGFKGAIYKSFETYEEAVEAFKTKKNSFFVKEEPKPKTNLSWKSLPPEQQPILDSLCVDASCLGNPGKLEYRGVHLKTGTEIFRMGPFEEGTNNIGEFLAIVHALALCKKQGSNVPIYSDSRNAITWVWDKDIRTTLKASSKNQALFDIMARALIWLKSNSYSNEILKWKTNEWGETPADFGRK